MAMPRTLTQQDLFDDEGTPTITAVEQSRVEESVFHRLKNFEEFHDLDPGIRLNKDDHLHYLLKGLKRLSRGYQYMDIKYGWEADVVGFLSKCQNSDGGYGGGPGQLSHLAPTYAAINCLCIIGTDEAFESIDSCQTYEGGIGGCPGAEAHGGYTFCGYAALVILGHEKLIDTDRLIHWLSNRQMRLEGGFQSSHDWMFQQKALQEYILISCQSRFGGLIDKPGKSPDYYHTCYCLSGLSIAQHSPDSSVTNIGDHNNILLATHPVYNISVDSFVKANNYFKEKPLGLET